MAQSSSTNSNDHDDWIDPRIEVTASAVNWDSLVAIACKIHQVSQAQWGEQKAGGYNVVRFLHLDDDKKTTIVVRVPLQSEDGMTRERVQAYCDRIASEVATMQYVEAHTNIPVPHVIHYSAEPDENGARSPYIMMSRVDGTPLSSVWNDMPDEKRDIVLRQVIDIYLELASHRFDKIGALFKGEGEGRDAWYVKPLSFITDPDEPQCAQDAAKVTHTSGADYWIAFANANLKDIMEREFGSEFKMHEYAHAWFMRSLVSSLYDPSLDASGFPLLPGDFHSQNIMIEDAETVPRITSVIDWEFSSTTCMTSFAQYPLFIVDHPQWPEDHPLRPRNVRDQAAFDRLILEAERKRDPTGGQRLSRAFATSLGAYLFEQCIVHPNMFVELYAELFEYVFGDSEDFSGDFYWALMEHGMLRSETKQFQLETEVWKDARQVLSDEIADQELTRSEFVKLVLEHSDRFQEGSKVLEWLENMK